MDILETTVIDQEAVESALKQIHYYNNLPKHIKGRVSELGSPQPNNLVATSPAHVIDGTMTVIRGKMNIPTFSQTEQFLKRTLH
ncbi:MAG: hypothetical protein HY094_04470 [Candidatus Melainabacteria bacterium]|nr:hypothetical protein [Candidatus Melainabacteria bacterium]